MIVLLYIFVAILALIGFSTLARGLAYSILRGGVAARLRHVVLVDNSNPELVVRDAVEQLNWSNMKYSNTLFAVDDGLDQNGVIITEKICNDYGIVFCKSEELGKVLK